MTYFKKLENLVKTKRQLSEYQGPAENATCTLPSALVKIAKQEGFSDKQIATFTKSSELAIRDLRKSWGKFFY